ncbi:MAG: T9SS type A sorting domain-containing protein [Bacteroidia bacterium]
MKKIIYTLLIAAGLFLCSQQHAAAQQPGINILYAGDSMGTYCQAPATIYFMIYGTAGGYLVTDSVTIYISYGDGNDTTFLSPILSSYFWENPSHTYTLPGIYSTQFIVTGPDGDDDTLTNVNSPMIATQCGNISGHVYFDANNDCIYNTGDEDMPWQWIKLYYNGNMVANAYTDANGDYYMSAASGFTYTIEVSHQNPNLVTTCPVSGSYTISSLPATNIDFGVNCSQSGFDLTGSLSCWGVRPGLTANVWIDYWNASCTPVSGTVTVTLPAGVSYVTGNPIPNNVNGQVLTYNVSPYEYFWQYPWSGYNYITVLGSPSLVIGDTVCFLMTLDPQTGDLNPSDNIIETCVPVRNSCDPNEKYETHAGWGTGYVAPGTQLDYTIFFQNVGNDVAFNINVIDTLDSDLDLNTLNIISASHDMNIRTLGVDILKFEFLNINLAAASVNEPESHGFIHYSISPKAGLANGTIMDNRAHIYFDFNGAIVTNTVTDIIDLSLGLNEIPASFTVNTYPNPASEFIQIKLGNESSASLQLIDFTGKTVVEKIIGNNETLGLDELSSGVYSLLITSPGKRYTGRVIVIK